MVTDRDELLIDFGAQKGSEAFRTFGWSSSEARETWTQAREAKLSIPAPKRAATYVINLRMRPMLAPPMIESQRVRVTVGETEVGSFNITQQTLRTCLVPWDIIKGRSTLDITLHLPDAARPSEVSNSRDNRMLGVAVSEMQFFPDVYEAWQDDAFLSEDEAVPVDASAIMAVDHMQLHELILRFESLGQNCEFGLVQRQCQAEPLGLLRFSSTPLQPLMDALEGRFEGMGEPGSLSVHLSTNGREYMVKDSKFGFLYHAWVNAGEMAPEDIVKRESRRVPFLVRKLLEDLEAGEKTFVFKGMGRMEEEEVFPLAMALRRYGPNTLLFVNLSDSEHKGGTVEARAPGFLVGYVDRFAPGDNAHDLLLGQWVKVCREATRLRIAAGAKLG